MSTIQQEQHDNIVELRRELAQWKNNHKNVVERLRIATQRKDLPVDRIPVINRMYELQNEVERLTAELAAAQNVAEAYGRIISAREKELAELRSQQAAVPAWIEREQLRKSLRNLLWAATERDKKNRIRQFDEFVDAAHAALTLNACVKGAAPQPSQPSEDCGCNHNCNQGRSCTCK